MNCTYFFKAKTLQMDGLELVGIAMIFKAPVVGKLIVP